MTFRVDPPAGGPENMAADLALLDSHDVACRVYTWDGPWVTLGRFQRPDRALVEGWDRWVTRPTGGRAVLHGHDLTVAMAIPIEQERDVATAYRMIVSPLVKALQACGLDAALAENRPTRGIDIADCFASSAACDVLANGHKVCGCALLIKGSRALLQASIPYRPPLVEPAAVIRGAHAGPVPPWRFEGLGVELESTLHLGGAGANRGCCIDRSSAIETLLPGVPPGTPQVRFTSYD